MSAPERPRSPLAIPAFRALWLAATVSFIGSFVQDIAERWVILDLTGSPLPAAMLSTAFVTASLVGMIPAGILADQRDRRVLVIVSQLAQAATAAVIAVLAWTGHVTPGILLAGAAIFGLGMALGTPAWNALLPEIVSRELVAEAIAWNAIAFNIARAIGPAFGGVILSTLGAPASFALNAASFLVVAVAMTAYRPEPVKRREPPPPLARAFAEPIRVAMRDEGVRSSLTSMVLFSAGASMVYGLAPAYGKTILGATAGQYGLMFGAMGLGAIVGTWALRRIRPHVAPRALVAGTILTYSLSAFAMSRVHSITLATLLFLPAGAGWTGTFSSLSTLVQLWTADRLRARMVALYTICHFGVWAVGSTVGGVIAEKWNVRLAMALGSLTCVLAGFVTSRLTLPRSFSGAPGSIPPPAPDVAPHAPPS